MSDLIDMIDDTTERLLRKVDNWEISQSDKKFITVEKEVYESVLRVNCNKIAECERLQKQLEIADTALAEIEKSGTNPEIKTITTLCVNNFLLAHKSRKEIEELNNVSR